jgi:hypothetical protein
MGLHQPVPGRGGGIYRCSVKLRASKIITLRVLFIGLVLLLSWTGQKIDQVLTNNEPANAEFYFYIYLCPSR